MVAGHWRGGGGFAAGYPAADDFALRPAALWDPAREGVGTVSIDVTDTPLSRAGSLPHKISAPHVIVQLPIDNTETPRK
ncbi:hypothetical protein PMm318_A46700 [Pseudomonas moorei]